MLGQPPTHVVPTLIPGFVRQNNNRGKREVNSGVEDYSDDYDDEYEELPYIGSSGDNIAPPWGTFGVTEQQAEEHCIQTIETGPSYNLCDNHVSDDDKMILVTHCKSDIQRTGFLEWADDNIEQYQSVCRSTILDRANSSDPSFMTLLSDFLTTVCPSNCSMNGDCQNGECICDSEHIGADCSLPKGTNPSLLKYHGPFACDVRDAPCQSIRIRAENLVDNGSLTCRIEINGANGIGQTFSSIGELLTAETIICKLPDLLSSSDTDPDSQPVAYTYQVSLSNDGVSFNDAVQLGTQTVWNTNLMWEECPEQEIYVHKAKSCVINGLCYMEGQTSDNDNCFYCSPSDSTDDWTEREGQQGDDCSSSTDTRPTIIKYLGPSMCDVQTNPCQDVTIQADNLVNSGSLTCRIHIYEANGFRRTFTYSGEHLSADTITCRLPLLLSSSSTNPEDQHLAYTYKVSLSNDGVNFKDANHLSSRTVWDSNLIWEECIQKEIFLHKSQSCLISSQCYIEDETRENNKCFYCNPAERTNGWTTTESDYGVWSSYGECSKDCDYGLRTRTRNCTGCCDEDTTQHTLCNTVNCQVPPAEVEEGVAITVTGANAQEIVESSDKIVNISLRLLNTYAGSNPGELCEALDHRLKANPSAANGVFGPENIYIGTGYPLVTNDSVQLKILAEVTFQDVSSICTSGARKKRETNGDVIFVDQDFIRKALSDLPKEIENNLGFQSDFNQDEREENSSKWLIIGVSVGAVVIVVLVITVVTVLKLKGNSRSKVKSETSLRNIDAKFPKYEDPVMVLDNDKAGNPYVIAAGDPAYYSLDTQSGPVDQYETFKTP